MADDRNLDWIASELQRSAMNERAPDHLRARIADLQRPAAPARVRSAPPRRLRVAVPALAAAVIIALVLILVLPGGPGTPSIAQAAAFAARPATAAAPARDPSAPSQYLALKVGSLRFPSWHADGGWRASGVRTDQLDGRAVTTVFYVHGSDRVAYTIVAAPVLAGQSWDYSHFREDGRTVVSWRQDGHSCLLSGRGVSTAALTRLAKTASA